MNFAIIRDTPAVRDRSACGVRNCAAADESEPPVGSHYLQPWPGMNEQQRYLFEVMGVLVVPNVVTPQALRELRGVLDAHNEAEPLGPDADGLQPGQNSFPRWRTAVSAARHTSCLHVAAF